MRGHLQEVSTGIAFSPLKSPLSLLCSCPTWVCCRTFHVVCFFMKPKPAIAVPHRTPCPFSSLLSIHFFPSNVQCFPFVGYFPTLGCKLCEDVVSASSLSCLLHVEQSLPHRCSVSISLMCERPGPGQRTPESRACGALFTAVAPHARAVHTCECSAYSHSRTFSYIIYAD